MARVARLTILLSSIWLTGSAWATTYYIAANGSDSNNGTSTSTPWLHAPAMYGATGVPQGLTIHAGDRFILRGGDTWYYKGAGTPTGLPWLLYSGSTPAYPDGSAGNLIYVGVDSTTPNASGAGTTGWYNTAVCGSWCRPIFSGGNPTSKSFVSSCAHSTGTFMDIASIQYLQLDNIEFTGICDNGSGGTYIGHGFGGSRGDYRVLSNLYFHGWTATSAYGIDDIAMNGSSYSNANPHDDLYNLVCDGWDSVNTIGACFFQGLTNLRNSVIRNNCQGIVTNSALNIHDNLFENIVECSQSGVHSNGMEWNTGYDSSTHYFYNNVVRNVTAAVGLWTCAGTGYTDYYFNNVVFNTPGGWSIANSNYNASGNACSSSTGTSGFYSNTLVSLGIGSPAAWNNARVNNYFVSSTWTGASGSTTNEVAASTNNATTYGYTSANNYAPTSADCNGNSSSSACPVGKGANLSSTCNAIPNATARAACLLDSTSGPAYDSSSHKVTGPARIAISRPSSGGWDAGAFQYSSQSVSVAAPTSLQAVVQ
jgi:hypothetical protein